MLARIFGDTVDLTFVNISVPGSFKVFATCTADVFPWEVHYPVFFDISDRFKDLVTDVACWKSLGSRERPRLCSLHLVRLHYYLFICNQ